MLKLETTKTSIAIIDPTTGARIEVVKEGKEIIRRHPLTGKDKQYGSYTSKFLKDLMTLHLPKKLSYEDRVKKMAKMILERNILSAPSIRNFSSKVRKAFDDGVLYPQGLYFYEQCK